MEAVRESVRKASVGTEIEYFGTVVAAYTSGGKPIRVIKVEGGRGDWYHTNVDGFGVNAHLTAAHAIVWAVKRYAPD